MDETSDQHRDGEQIMADHLNDIWEENDTVLSDKKRILEFFRENDSKPYQPGYVLSEVLGHTSITLDVFDEMPETIPSLPDEVVEGQSEEERKKHMITEMATFQANRARVRNLLDNLVYEGFLEKKELPYIDVYRNPLEDPDESDEELEEIRKHGSTETFYKYAGDSE